MADEFEWCLPMLRSGQAKTKEKGTADVSFVTPMIDANYAISLTVLKEKEIALAQCVKKSAEGFAFETTNINGEPLKNIAVMWLCLPEINS